MSDSFKSISLVNAEGKSLGLSNEEVLSLRLNQWKGWKCSAGVENIFITADGNIYSATCRVGGWLGNVYDQGFKLPEKWLTCTKEWCMCGQDMQLRKVREESFLPLVHQEPPAANVNKMEDADAVMPFHFKSFQEFPKFVTWDLGRRCNFSCNYCNESISNNYEAHKSWGSLKHAAENILKSFVKGDKARWIFTGGEPTINPDFMKLVSYLSEGGHNLHTQTNGSRSPEYHRELIRHSSIGVSLHLKFMSEEKVLRLAEAIIDEQVNHKKASQYWFGVRVMVPPGHFDKALSIKKALQKVKGFDEFGHIFMSPLYANELDRVGQMVKYDEKEYEQIIENA